MFYTPVNKAMSVIWNFQNSAKLILCLGNVVNTLDQRSSNYGPRTTSGPRDLPLWSLKNTEDKLKFK